MALDGNRLGSAVAAAIQGFGIVAGPQITTSQLEQIWQAVFREDVTEYKSFADILPASHGGLALNNPTGQPVLIPSTASPGSPSSGATNAPQVIAGTGSIT